MAEDQEASTTARRSVPGALLAASCVLAVVSLIWYLGVFPFWEPNHVYDHGLDARVYRGGARALLDGHWLYAEPVQGVMKYTYTPFAALLMIPFGWLSLAQTAHAVDALNVLFLVLLVFLSLRALGYTRDRRFWFTVIAASIGAALLDPVRQTFSLGQINLFLAVLVVGCLTLPMGRWRGIGVGLAAGIKLTPLFFVAYFVITRQWRAALVAVATFVATVLVGLAVLHRQAWDYWTHYLTDTERIGPLDWPQNQSVNGFLARLDSMGIWQAPDWLWVPIGVVLGLLGLYAAWRAYTLGAVLLAVTVTGVTMCAVAPFTWSHHWVWLVPLLLTALAQASTAARSGRPRTWWWWLAPVVVFFLGSVWPTRELNGDGKEVWAFGTWRMFYETDAHGWALAGSLFSSGAYLIVFLLTVAVTLWWSRRADPIRFTPTTVSAAQAAA